MKIEGKAYLGKVMTPKVWEGIIDENGKKQNVLISETVSQYIRKLEGNQCLDLNK